MWCDMEAASKGLQNYVCPAEIGMLLKQVYDRTFASAAISERIERTLLEQQVRHKIPGYIGMDKKIANKTGEEDGTTNDAAIVFAKKPFILVICANKTDVPETERFIRQVALDLYKENGGDWDAK